MPTEIIYGLECNYPECVEIPNKGINKFVCTDISILDKFILDDEDNPLWDAEQREVVLREIDRCNKGYYFWNNDVLTYITGFYYYYLNYWTLENGRKAEYRDADRRFFLFFQNCYDDPKVIGIVRGKKRREGASSQGTAIGTKIATFSPNKNYGNVSMNDDYAEKLYQGMVLNGFLNLPEFLKPRMDKSGTNKKRLHFIKTPKRGDGIKKIEGLNSVIDFLPTMLNSYDSTRLSFLLGDEWGKWEKIDITRYFEVVKECVRTGARKVGFVYAPTTVNPPQKGGDNFKKLWDGSNQFLAGKYGTSTGMVKYFQPAYEGMDGFIDEYGMSVIEPPNEKTLQYLVWKQEQVPDVSERVPKEDLEKGAKKYLEDEFAKLITEEQKSDFRRKFPIVEEDMFDFGATYSPFNISHILEQEKYLRDNPKFLRRGNWFWDYEEQQVKWSDDENGKWLVYQMPELGVKKFEIVEFNNKKTCKPLNSHSYGGGADTYRFDKVSTLGSNGAICIGTKFDQSKENEEDRAGKLCALYVGRPPLKELFWKEILLATLAYGCTVTIETDATDDWYKYFTNKTANFLDCNCMPMLGKKPDAAINPFAANQEKARTGVGVSSADSFIFAKQIELAQIYFEKYCKYIYYPIILKQAKEFNPDNRTKFDELISFMLMLLNINGAVKSRAAEYKRIKYIEQYNVP